MSMGTDQSIDDFHARLINVTSQCYSLGDPFEEHRIVKKFLRSLPPSFQSKQTAIEEAQDIDTYSLDELVGNLKTFEMRVNPAKKVKSVAFNSVKKEEETEVSTEDLAYLTKQFKKFFKFRNSSGQGSKIILTLVQNAACLLKILLKETPNQTKFSKRKTSVKNLNVLSVVGLGI
ncbi:hypothetical protein RchiOBHm_Chr4g0421211 [Rosa chinensis]|uniref:UBN2 domain-containing protein n=1 Tax=Rosa chinensis TaxID=74649 RepID=A0A2P6QY07_ROSCH|nr:hypothetical protein RchiOBHm_Chr4g0421211 [Rosa chinensis]